MNERVSAGSGISGHVFPDIHQRPALRHAFCDTKDLVGDLFANIILPAVRADLGGNFLDNKGQAVTLESNGCHPFLRLPVFTDNTLHDLLRVKSPAHASWSGSYAVITIASRATLLYAVTLNIENVEYEPEQFPGLVYRIKDPRIVVLIFSSGKIVLTGDKNLKDIRNGLDVLEQKLESVL